MNRFLGRCVCAFSMLGLAAVAAPAAAGPFSSLFIFGDSLSDTGNNAAVFDSMGAGSGLPPG
ncbi:MAG: hypothetical protein KF710_12720, partial [Rhodocyclaceae bacterium]|nr:hypothetical protein [Rhodocyclaceae bacterium]